jgi:hypothetical protein
MPVTNCWHFVIKETPDGTPSVPNVTKENLVLLQKEYTMCLAVKRLPVERPIAIPSVDRDIRDFVAGRTDGADLLHAIYDHVLDEPVPQHLRAVLRR